MHLTSLPFLAFLGGILIIYAATPVRLRWVVLLAASMGFYASWGPIFLLYILGSCLVTYTATLFLAKDGKPLTGRGALAAGITINLAALAVTKYSGFIAHSAGAIFGAQSAFVGLALPLGISFYTFQSIGYMVDVYRGVVVRERNIFRLLLFVSFFPQLIQGPISRFGDLARTLFAGSNFGLHSIERGAKRMLWGFFLKLIIADRLSPALVVLVGESEYFTGAYYILTILLHAIVLFCDFTGGIHIAIGAAEMFGVVLPENFNRPFYAKSVQEFWNRWHMTLYAWFRDYVFYPLSLSRAVQKISAICGIFVSRRVSRRIGAHFSLICVWLLTGIWHAPTAGFVAWGLATGLVIILSVELRRAFAAFRAKFPRLCASRAYGAFMIVRTFLLLSVLRSLFAFPSLRTAAAAIGGAFALPATSISGLGLAPHDYVVAGAGLAIVFFAGFLGRGGVAVRDRLDALAAPVRYAVYAAGFFAVLVFGAYGHGFDVTEFIYHQF